MDVKYALKSVDFSSIIFSTMRFCATHTRNCALPYANLLTLIFDHFNLLSEVEEVDCSGPISLSSEILPSLGIFKIHDKYELYSNLSSNDKENLQKVHGKRLNRLEPLIKEHTTLSRLQSLDLEVGEMKSSLLALHDKVSTLTFMLDSFIKDMKGIVVEDVVVEEEVVDGDATVPKEDEGMEKAKEQKEGEEAEKKIVEDEAEKKDVSVDVADTTPIQTVPPTVDELTSSGKPEPSKKRKRRSRK